MAEKETGKRRTRSRRLSEEERRLWQHAMRNASPMPRHARQVKAAEEPEDKKTPEAEAETTFQRRPLGVGASQTSHLSPLPRTEKFAPLPFTGIDRRTSQRLGRGQIDYEAKLDLHGFSRENAQMVLRRFLAESRHAGLRCVLVVTGKGESPFARHTLHGTHYYDTPERQGVLRTSLPQWLEEPELRAVVSGFQPAHPRHGGGGAFYVLLRRRR